MTEEKFLSLGKDGISEELYRLLWTKDELNYGPPMNIPDTIVYKFGQPVSWYFTSISGKVKKKNKGNLISAKIEEAFNKQVLGYDVLAQFISIPSERESESTVELDAHANVIEYFDRNALNKFLYTLKKDVNGILQRFVEPKTTKNEIIRAIWSPKVCLLERIENKHQLHDHRYGLYERCVLYEGPEYYTTSAPLRGPVLSGQIQKICESVVSHISEVTYGQKLVSRIVMNFKLDSRDKIWLLFSTSIRCTDMLEYRSASDSQHRQLLNIDSVVALPRTVHLNPTKTYEKIIPKHWIRCLSCAKDTLSDLRHPVTYKVVIKHYEHVLYILASSSSSSDYKGPKSSALSSITWPPDTQVVEAAGGVGFGCLYINDQGEVMSPVEIAHHSKQKSVSELQIPPILHNIHYKLSQQSYARCKHDPLFLYKTVQVCEACYLVYAEFMTMLLRMGQDLTKLLTPDAAAFTKTAADRKPSSDRPSSADWRSMSVSNNSSHVLNRSQSVGSGFKPSANHIHARESAIGLRSDERHVPALPTVVRDKSASSSVVLDAISHASSSRSDAMIGWQDSIAGIASDVSHATGGSQSSSQYDANEIKSAIAERERNFFKEISLNPNLKDQHPLMHLINAQQKLKLVDQQSGILSNKASAQSESIFGTRYGKQSNDLFQKNGAYAAEIPYTINGKVILPSKLKAITKERSRRKKLKDAQSFRALLSPNGSVIGMEDVDGERLSLPGAGGGSDATATSSNPSTADPNVKASVKHRDFLAEQLKHIDDFMSSSSSFVGQYSGSLDDPFVKKYDKGKGGTTTPSKASRSRTAASDNERVKTPTTAAIAGTNSGHVRIVTSSSDAHRVKQQQQSSLSSSSDGTTTRRTDVQASPEESQLDSPLLQHTENNNNNSLEEPSTESALLRSWGISKEGSLTAEESALEMQLVKEEALPLKQLMI